MTPRLNFRRRFVLTGFAAILSFLASGLSRPVAAGAAETKATSPERPNIVYIISDDQAFRDFGFMGNKMVDTPHLDALAAKSARFVNGYVPTSVCSPSLATLLTGLYPHQSGLHYNHPPPGNSAFNKMTSRAEYEQVRSQAFYLIRSVDTLPRLLAERAGYASLQTGKFWEGHYSNAGFTEGMTVFEPDTKPGALGNRKLASGELAAHGNGDLGLRIGRDTMQPIYDFIGRQASANKPWLVWYAPFLPHQPHDSPRKYYERYEGRPYVPEHAIPYYAAISQFDDTVGELVRYVEEKGLAENTLFVFVIDNGWAPSTKRERNRPEEFAHTEESKRSPFEDGLRTPILLRWDGVIPPATHEELVSSVDIVPTLLHATGLGESAKELPGINLLPVAMRQAKLDPDRAVFGEIYPGDASSLGHPSEDVAYRWVRKGHAKLIVTHRHGDEKKSWGGYLDGDALFLLGNDPEEKHNVIDQELLKRELVPKLRRLLDDWWTPGDDSGVAKP